MSDGMPDDWRDVVKKITDDWSDNLEDLMVKHSEAEFLKHAASTGVNFNLIQTEALEKLVLQDVGFVAQTNKKIGQSIIDDIEKLLITKGDWASAKESVLEHVNNVFSGQEKIVIDNIGKQVKRAVLDAELGHVVLKDFTVKRKWTGNVNAYSDMVAKSLSQKARTMGDLEGYRTTIGIIGWRRMSSLGGKTCQLCASLHGTDYYFGGEHADVLPAADGLMFEPHPNGFCYQTPIYDEWTGLKNLDEFKLDFHLEKWKIEQGLGDTNLMRVPKKYHDSVRKAALTKLTPLHTETLRLTKSAMFDEDYTYRIRSDLSADEIDSIAKYAGTGYRQINRSAAGRTTDSIRFTESEVAEHITNIDNAILKSILKDDTIVYRGLEQHVVDDLLINGGRQSLGFMSTSLSPSDALFFTRHSLEDKYRTLLVINRQKGSTGVFLDSVEKEVLLPRGVKYKVTKVVESDILEIDGKQHSDIRLMFVELL